MAVICVFHHWMGRPVLDLSTCMVQKSPGPIIVCQQVRVVWPLVTDKNRIEKSGCTHLHEIFVGWFSKKNNNNWHGFFFRLFVLPHYCSAMVDLSLLHSRKKRNQSKEEYKEEISKADSKVYICATMWHENRIEMKQILISIFRYFKTRSSIWYFVAV